MVSASKPVGSVQLVNKRTGRRDKMKEFEIVIDGKVLKAKENQTILDVARENGIEIPTLCYLKNVSKPASCRLCVVEVEGARNLLTACSTKVRPDMKVKTNTGKVIKARKTALELLLSNHNRNCLSCSKSLKCDLQRLCDKYQCDTSKYGGGIEPTMVDASNHAIVRDESKCILCGKCVAVCKNIQHCSAIGKIGRGYDTKVGTVLDISMQNSTCVGCGQCVLVCPTGALTQKSAVNSVLNILDESDVIKIAQVAPAVRVAIGEEFGSKMGEFSEGKMVSALKASGFDYVFDVNNGADFTVIEEAQELIERLTSGEKKPLFTSCCPAWFNYCEKFYPEYVPNLSSSKSPNEMLGSLVKHYYESQGKKVKIVSIMPCTAKKREIIAHGGIIEESLTTRELAELIRLKEIDFNGLPDSKFDDPFGEYSGGALIFGVTGGVTEAALRYAVNKITGEKPETIDTVRHSSGIKETTVKVGDIEIKLAVVHGLSNAHKVMEDIVSGDKYYDFIEVMACPGGCINGGGQPYVDYSKVDVEDVIRERTKSMYGADKKAKYKSSEDNESVAKIYKDLLKNDKHLIHELLHYETQKDSIYVDKE